MEKTLQSDRKTVWHYIQIHDEAKNKTKIVHFDCLKKARLSSVKLDQSDNKSEFPSENDSDATFEIVITLRYHVPRRPAAPDVAHKAQPEAAAAAKVKPNQLQTANNVKRLKPRELLQSRRARSKQQMIKRRCQPSFLHD